MGTQAGERGVNHEEARVAWGALFRRLKRLRALRKKHEETNILLEWRCEACNWRVVIPTPGFPGDGYRHLHGDATCGPLVARRVGGWARLPSGASPEEIEEALESTR